MTNEHSDAAAAEALGALAPDESTTLAADVERDPELAAELGEYRATVSMLEASVARERPSYDLFAGILAQVDPEPVRTGAATRRSAWSWRRALPAFVIGAAAAAAVFAVALALGTEGAPGTPDAVAAVQGTPEFAGVHGEARIYDSASTGGVLRLELADVPAAPAGEHYEVWVLRPSAGTAMEAVGVFNPAGSNVELELGLPGAGDYAAVDISVEPDAGSPEHSGTSLAGGTFERGTT